MRTRLPRLAALAALGWAAAAAAASAAETRMLSREVYCEERGALAETLAARHGEVRAWWGVSGDGEAMVELYLAPETGSWTFLQVDPAGMACVLAGGDSGALEPPEGFR